MSKILSSDCLGITESEIKGLLPIDTSKIDMSFTLQGIKMLVPILGASKSYLVYLPYTYDDLNIMLEEVDKDIVSDGAAVLLLAFSWSVGQVITVANWISSMYLGVPVAAPMDLVDISVDAVTTYDKGVQQSIPIDWMPMLCTQLVVPESKDTDIGLYTEAAKEIADTVVDSLHKLIAETFTLVSEEKKSDLGLKYLTDLVDNPEGPNGELVKIVSVLEYAKSIGVVVNKVPSLGKALGSKLEIKEDDMTVESTKIKGGSASKTMGAKAIDLSKAKKMYTPVLATSAGSKYFLVARYKDGLNLAARITMSGTLSVRVGVYTDSPGPVLSANSSELKKAGLAVYPSKGYSSGHFSCFNTDNAVKTLGAVLASLKFTVLDTAPDLYVLVGEGA